MLTFYKYHGAGNDFVMIDNRHKIFNKNNIELVKKICHRHFSVGADGVLLLENSHDYDFEMIYINSDGSYGSMCGNGGRCIVQFANSLGMVRDLQHINFCAAGEIYQAQMIDGRVRLKMQDVSEITERNGLPFLYSGNTPHQVVMVADLDMFPVLEQGKKIRYADTDPQGVNVNFVEEREGIFHVRTYERGVENETLACGTGATSVAIYCASKNLLKNNFCSIKMPGGTLKISFEKNSNGTYQNIWLEGPTTFVYTGEIRDTEVVGCR